MAVFRYSLALAARPPLFTEMIRRKLGQVSLAETMAATALSRPYCAMIRRGERVPRGRHWDPRASELAALGSLSGLMSHPPES